MEVCPKFKEEFIPNTEVCKHCRLNLLKIMQKGETKTKKEFVIKTFWKNVFNKKKKTLQCKGVMRISLLIIFTLSMIQAQIIKSDYCDLSIAKMFEESRRIADICKEDTGNREDGNRIKGVFKKLFSNSSYAQDERVEMLVLRDYLLSSLDKCLYAKIDSISQDLKTDTLEINQIIKLLAGDHGFGPSTTRELTFKLNLVYKSRLKNLKEKERLKYPERFKNRNVMCYYFSYKGANIEIIKENQILVMKCDYEGEAKYDPKPIYIDLISGRLLLIPSIDSIIGCKSISFDSAVIDFIIECEGYKKEISFNSIKALNRNKMIVNINDKNYKGYYNAKYNDEKESYSLYGYHRDLYLVTITKEDILGDIKNVVRYSLIYSVQNESTSNSLQAP